MVKNLEDLFPGIRGQPYKITSPASLQYNCIAWAAGDDRNWWWPDEDGMDVWPAGVDRVATVETFRARIKEKLGISNLTELIQRAAQWVVESRYRSD